MKKAVFILLFVLTLTPIAVNAAGRLSFAVDEYEPVAENEYLVLLLKRETTEIAVLDKRTDTIWYANPPERAVEEEIARGAVLQRIGAQVSIVYFNQRNIESIMDNANDSIPFGQMEIEIIENGVRVAYTLGEEWRADDYLPNVMPKERFERLILDKIEDPADRQYVLEKFPLVWFEEAPAGYSRVNVPQINKEILFGNMTIASNPEHLTGSNPKRNLYDNLFEHLVGVMEDITTKRDVTKEIIAPFLEEPIYITGRRLSRWDREELIRIVKTTGFTPEDRAPDLEKFGFKPVIPNHRVFDLVIEYLLDGEDLVVRIPMDEVRYPVEAVNPEDPTGPRITLRLHSISVLPYFGAAGRNQQGYIFVPDGSGALIYLNNGKISERPYSRAVYDIDNSLSLIEEEMRYRQPVVLPVFGMNQGEKGFFAVIEEGAAVARIRCEVAGRIHSYNTVYPEFVVMPKGETIIKVADEAEGRKYDMLAVPQSRLVDGELRVRYSFLYGAAADYVGMAHHYQKYLQDRHALQPREQEQKLPFYLEVVGGVQKRMPVFGIPRDVVLPLTTFEQAGRIVAGLQEAGVENIKLRYSGWMRGGLDHDYPTRVKWEPQVGGERDFRALHTALTERRVDFFPETAFLNVSKNSWFDGYAPRSHSARYLDHTLARVFSYDRASYQRKRDEFRYILSPRLLPGLVHGFSRDYGRLGVGNLALRHLGNQLNSDFRENPKRLIDRGQALQIHREQLQYLSEQFRLMVDGGFAYTLPYVSHILNIPLASSQYMIFDETVPFYPIVLHGFVNYAGEPANLADNYRRNLLKTIETGAVPYFKWSYAEPQAVKQTRYDHLYALHYQDWFSEAVEFYHRAGEVLEPVQGQRIIGHRQVEKDVYETTYENGFKVVVNYKKVPVQVGGITIGGESYRLFEGD